jgi:hypothetical protein
MTQPPLDPEIALLHAARGRVLLAAGQGRGRPEGVSARRLTGARRPAHPVYPDLPAAAHRQALAIFSAEGAHHG